jgi:hypothetical protein
MAKKKTAPAKPTIEKVASLTNRNMGFEPEQWKNYTVMKRVFRWTFEFIANGDCLVPEHFVKNVVLPKYYVKRDRRAIQKGWTQLSVSYYDIAGQNKELWDWILSNPVEATAATVKYFDGCGTLLEELILQIEPAEIKISDPNYASSEVSEITIVFDTKKVERVVHISATKT